MRQVILDTETTGLDPKQGHRIIEIGCVELIDRRFTQNDFHFYLQPDREIDVGALNVHGITNEFLKDKPRFQDIVVEFIDYIKGAELIIHNAPFDIGFLNYELKVLNRPWNEKTISDFCSVTDTLVMARRMHPGQRNSLDVLCKRYSIDNSMRDRHGALLDAELLGRVYLSMTGGQGALMFTTEQDPDSPNIQEKHNQALTRTAHQAMKLIVIPLLAEEQFSHDEYLRNLEKVSGSRPIWFSEVVESKMNIDKLVD